MEAKIYKMNDYEWWASKWNKEKTHEYYLKECGLNKEDDPIDEVYESDLDTNGMWNITNDPEDIERLGEKDEIISYETVNGMNRKKVRFGDLMRYGGEVCKFMSFREALEIGGEFEEPFCIASTEF